MSSILIVEDNQDMRKGLKQFFEREGFFVTEAASCEDGIDFVDEQTFDVCLIDINLPGKSGYELIDYIRAQGNQMPLIAMTARDAIDDKLRGFDLGLTDYIVKPFDRKEVLARVDVHLKRSQSSKDGVVKTDNFSINQNTFQFMADAKLIELTKIEFRMMYILMQNNRTIVENEELISFVWGEDDTMLDPPVRIHIANLRKKIGDTDFKIIRTIPAVGYIFNDPLE